MVFNSLIVLSVAHLSADASQCIARFPDRLTSHQLLYLLFGFPLQQLSHLALSLWTFFCVPPPGSFYYYYPSDSDVSSYDYASDWLLFLVIFSPFLHWWDGAFPISASGFSFFLCRSTVICALYYNTIINLLMLYLLHFKLLHSLWFSGYHLILLNLRCDRGQWTWLTKESLYYLFSWASS